MTDVGVVIGERLMEGVAVIFDVACFLDVVRVGFLVVNSFMADIAFFILQEIRRSGVEQIIEKKNARIFDHVNRIQSINHSIHQSIN